VEKFWWLKEFFKKLQGPWVNPGGVRFND